MVGMTFFSEKTKKKLQILGWSEYITILINCVLLLHIKLPQLNIIYIQIIKINTTVWSSFQAAGTDCKNGKG